MQRSLSGYIVGSILLGAMGFAACSSDDDGDDDGVGGSEIGGAAGATTKVGGAGGATTKTGTGGSAPTSSAQGGSHPTSSSAQGGSTSISSVPTAGTTAVAGAPSGGATATGGAATGGTTAAGGMTATEAAGAGGMGQAGEAGAPTAGAAGANSTTPTVNGWTFDSGLESWTVPAASDSHVLDMANGVLFMQVVDGVVTWGIPFVRKWNGMGSPPPEQSSYVGVNTPNIDLAGKTVTVRSKWVSGGTGSTTGVSAAFDFYVTFNDSDGSIKRYPTTPTGFTSGSGDKGGAFKDLTVTLPATPDGEFNPASIKNVAVSVTASMWTDTPQPTFDYDSVVFYIDSVTHN